VAPKSKNLSIVTVIDEIKTLGFQIFEGSVTAKDYGFFLLELIINFLEIKNNLNNYCFYMDNASIHKSKEIK